ncbi:MAG TPA: hypothetical protein VHV26_17045, partial [Rhizomicrobium sp.]|nr:hypothetical protein [Rhizomicrobium sp.]
MTAKDVLFAALGAALFCLPANGTVTRITVESRKSLSDGYELLQGRFEGALDPANPHNAIINDIKLAPRDAKGMVGYSAS